jgi:uncharacterized protein (TIGR00661 family)
MKILYAIQGTGNGHISRARDIIPILSQKGELDILVSGTQSDVDLGFPIKYRFKGMSFIFGKKGGVDMVSTYKKAKLKRFFAEVKSLPVRQYDLILSDFEPVSAWACKYYHKECIGLSHQAAVLNKKSPQPRSADLMGKSILKNYAPVTRKYGFHFQSYSKKIFTPVIREAIRNAPAETLAHYTVYLPAYSDEKIIKTLGQVKEVEWQVFSKHSKSAYDRDNVHIQPINNEAFIKSLVSCTGVFCGAGFETPAESLFLKKKLMVIPMKGQFEQQCNAAALKEMGVPVMKKLKQSKLERIRNWVKNGAIIPVDYPNITRQIIEEIIEKNDTNATASLHVPMLTGQGKRNVRHIKLGRVLHQITG